MKYKTFILFELFSDFEVEKKKREALIMEKILTEEERMKKRKKQQPQLWTDPKREKSLVQ